MPTVPAVVRDSFIGTLVYFASGRRCFTHPEEQPDFVLPDKYSKTHQPAQQGDQLDASSQVDSNTATVAGPPSREGRGPTQPEREEGPEGSQTAETSSQTTARPSFEYGDLEKGEKSKIKQKERVTEQPPDNEIVGWYGPDDPECPRNVRSHSSMAA